MNSVDIDIQEKAKRIIRDSPILKLSPVERVALEIKYLSWRVKRKYFFRSKRFSLFSGSKPFANKEDIEIVITVFGKSEMIEDCLSSIESSIGINPSVIIVDNGITEKVREKIKSYKCVRTYIENGTNLGFGGACDKGIKSCSGEYVLLMNSDITVRDDAIRQLIEVIRQNEKFGLCSSVLINKFGRAEEVGRVLDKHGNAKALFENHKEKRLPTNDFIVVPYSSFACVLVKSKVYEKTGGFDPAFYPAYSEDVDLAIEFQKAGFVSVVSTKSKVFHAQGSSTAELENLDQIKDQNRKTLIDKQKEYFAKLEDIYQPFRNPDQLLRAKFANLSSRQLLVVHRESELENISELLKIPLGEFILHEIAVVVLDLATGKPLTLTKEFVDSAEEIGIDVYDRDQMGLKNWVRHHLCVFENVYIDKVLFGGAGEAIKWIKASQPQAQFIELTGEEL